jgi:dTDP-4-amino-4,6-dideoxygalactose transaminase
VGTNSRLDALQAAVLRAKLPHLESWTTARRRNAALYDELLADVPEVETPFTRPGVFHVFNQYTIRAGRRDQLKSYLDNHGVGSAVYYPLPLHLQECFRTLGYARGDFPVSERLAGEVLSLPIYPELGEARIQRVARTIREFYGL